jgi:hypothetical protein
MIGLSAVCNNTTVIFNRGAVIALVAESGVLESVTPMLVGSPGAGRNPWGLEVTGGRRERSKSPSSNHSIEMVNFFNSWVACSPI